MSELAPSVVGQCKVSTPLPMQPVSLRACSLVSAAGYGLNALAQALRDNRVALQPNTFTSTPLTTWIGRVSGLDEPLQPTSPGWPQSWVGADSRAVRLAFAGLLADNFLSAAQAACQRYGAHRVALALGTSASTIDASEAAYRESGADGVFPDRLRHPRLNSLHAVTEFVRDCIGLRGPAVTVSTACSSSAKVFAQAQRWLALGLADAVVVGGVDALSHSLLFGFQALQLVAAGPCQPFGGSGGSGGSSAKGINVGEAAGFVLLEPTGPDDDAVQLSGYGESNDAHHMSSPHPQGVGAEAALRAALARAAWAADDVRYLQLHGTGTALNDAVEAAMVARCYSPAMHASALKGCLGHTMGAAGIVGALACLLALRSDSPQGLCAGTPGTERVDTALPEVFSQQLRLQPEAEHMEKAASHAFGFGGNNAVLLFSRSNGCLSDGGRP